MPIRILLEHRSAFGPDDIKVIVAAFEEACHELHVPQGDPRRDEIAFQIFTCAQSGERDPERLKHVGQKKPPA